MLIRIKPILKKRKELAGELFFGILCQVVNHAAQNALNFDISYPGR